MRKQRCLDLGHGGDVGGLDVVLALVDDALLELVERDLGVLDDEGALELADTVADGDELGGAPDEAVHLDGLDGSLELLHVGLVVPRLDVESDERLGGGAGALGGLLLVVLGNTLGLDALGLLVDLVVGAEEVDVIVVLLGGGGRGGEGGGEKGGGLGLVTGQVLVLSLVRGDVLVPAGDVGELVGVGGLAESLVNGDIGLRGRVADDESNETKSATLLSLCVRAIFCMAGRTESPRNMCLP